MQGVARQNGCGQRGHIRQATDWRKALKTHWPVSKPPLLPCLKLHGSNSLEGRTTTTNSAKGGRKCVLKPMPFIVGKYTVILRLLWASCSRFSVVGCGGSYPNSSHFRQIRWSRCWDEKTYLTNPSASLCRYICSRSAVGRLRARRGVECGRVPQRPQKRWVSLPSGSGPCAPKVIQRTHPVRVGISQLRRRAGSRGRPGSHRRRRLWLTS